jgi:hypothetical protein
MDLTQNKLSRSEWESIEVPSSSEEKAILKMMIDGFHHVDIHTNKNQSLFAFTKIERTDEIEMLLFERYFKETMDKSIKKYGKSITLQTNTIQGTPIKKMKSADMIRINNLETNIKENKQHIYEFVLMELFHELLKNLHKNKPQFALYLYTLRRLEQNSIQHINKYVVNTINRYLIHAEMQVDADDIIKNAYNFIERNSYLLKYQDLTLFEHQKQLFQLFSSDEQVSPKLVLYTAPTGTGKTISPVGLSEGKRIIFVCVARHIGLALAKACISVEKNVAFAFGCKDESDIRLHYFSAVNYTKNRRSGGIGKVDNSVGTNVEIMICDVQSYLTSMNYMMRFNPTEKLVTYWDEPTITMDYDDHDLHNIIHQNWKQNKIPNMVLSCATLPSEDEIKSVFTDFQDKFQDAEIHTIKSYDCRKSIPMINKQGFAVLPHLLYENYAELVECVNYCKENLTLLRYFDLNEIIRFIKYVTTNEYVLPCVEFEEHFQRISDVTMNSIKFYYLEVLSYCKPESWTNVYNYMKNTQLSNLDKTTQSGFGKSKSEMSYSGGSSLKRTTSTYGEPNTTKNMNPNSKGILLTTSDAHTLTDGPTIFLCEDVKKIGHFYIQQSNIPTVMFQSLLHNISKNDEIINKITYLENAIANKETKVGADNEETSARESGRLCHESQQWMNQIEKMRKDIKLISLDATYVPNSVAHQKLWTPDNEVYENAFVASLDEDHTRTIMSLNIDNHLKVLLLLGIGMFIENVDVKYMELMKQLASEQRLFIIIASSDYIYGTNYQFCHGFIGKDLTKMTQQKTLQALGRIGRNNIQQDYSVRFRDDNMISQLFKPAEHNVEANNMCKLFSSKN